MANIRGNLIIGFDSPGNAPAEWHVSRGLTPYETALATMEARAAASATAAGTPVHSAPTMADMAAVPMAPPQNSFANGPRRMA